jgi:hypothetical protein
MGGPTETKVGRTREQVVFIIETVQVEVPDGMFKGGTGFGCGFEVIVKF